MKALVRKELRENIKVTLLGLIIYTLLVMFAYHSSTERLATLIVGAVYGDSDMMQPLLGSSFQTSTGFFCALFGALLGWLQIHNERHRDLWAFLVHRPVSRTTIFLSKVISGLILYTLAVSLPMLVLIAVVRTPGHVAAPFEWAMVLPALVYFLAGSVFYFAGLLTGLRQARWYVSRGLGLGAAIVAVGGVGACRNSGRPS